MYYKGYLLTNPKPTGGKAGKGRNKTSTVQIRETLKNGFLVIKSIRYNVNEPVSKINAISKAKKYIDGLKPPEIICAVVDKDGTHCDREAIHEIEDGIFLCDQCYRNYKNGAYSRKESCAFITRIHRL